MTVLWRRMALALVLTLLVVASAPAGARYAKSPVDPPSYDAFAGAMRWTWHVDGADIPDGTYVEFVQVQVVIEYHCTARYTTCYQLLIEGALATVECSWNDWNYNVGGSLIPVVDPVHTYRMDACGVDIDRVGPGGACLADAAVRATHGSFDMRGEGFGAGGCTLRDL